jgi:hypothetical protein
VPNERSYQTSQKKSEAVVLGVDLMSLYSAIIPKNSR